MSDVVMIDIEQHGRLVEVVAVSGPRFEDRSEFVDGKEVDVQFVAHFRDNLLILVFLEIREDLDGERVELLLAFVAVSACELGESQQGIPEAIAVRGGGDADVVLGNVGKVVQSLIPAQGLVLVSGRGLPFRERDCGF